MTRVGAAVVQVGIIKRNDIQVNFWKKRSACDLFCSLGDPALKYDAIINDLAKTVRWIPQRPMISRLVSSESIIRPVSEKVRM